jgi:methylated-DNA-[protein]-cysteine S-methyltransferase
MSSDVIMATTIDTPIGPLSLLARGDALVGGGFTADPGELHVRLSPALRALPLAAGDLPWAAKPASDYFDGDLAALDGLAVYQPATPARERLWAELRKVRAGAPVSYAELARRAGSPRAVRAAGGACASNLVAPVVPCHRVIRTDGSLGGYYYGLDRKEWLLRHERAAA